jgi:dethiobiotin synthetase
MRCCREKGDGKVGQGILISATDTGAGKTYVACLLGKRLRQEGIAVRPLKPVESGCVTGPDGKPIPADAAALRAAFAPKLAITDICLYPLRAVLSPHLAAREEGVVVDVMKIIQKAREAEKKSALLLLEGAGGITVELKEGCSFADLARDLSYPVLIVAENRLGVLNCLKLTIRFLLAEGLPLFGVILNDHAPEPSPARERNEAEARIIAGDAYLGRIPFNASALPDGLFANFQQRLRKFS